MKVTFKQVNSNFNKTHANQYNAGKDSINNMKQ